MRCNHQSTGKRHSLQIITEHPNTESCTRARRPAAGQLAAQISILSIPGAWLSRCLYFRLMNTLRAWWSGWGGGAEAQ